MGATLKTATEVEVHDVVRFFHGDGPAAQFEAGHKQGGTYCCIGCGADSGHFADSYRAPMHSLLEWQKFVLQGGTWRKGGLCMYPHTYYITCMHIHIHVRVCIPVLFTYSNINVVGTQRIAFYGMYIHVYIK